MRRMSPDEVLVAITAAIVAAVGWVRWYRRLAGRASSMAAQGLRPALAALPVVAVIGIFIVLRIGASFDVRFDPTYLGFYLVFGAAWLVAARSGARRLNLSWIDDAMERRNPAAVAALAGAILGAAACYAGGNVGDGPGWWCVLIAGGLATGFWLLLWLVLERLAHVSEAITVERDAGAGLRLGGWLLASGLICGRAAAGDWYGLGPTVVDFAAAAWPALPLAAVAIVVEWRRSKRPMVPSGATPAADAWLAPSVALAAAYVVVAVAVYVIAALPAPGPAPLGPAEAL
jgi:hypothetical protein